MYHFNVNEARGRVVFENNGKALWSYSDRNMSSNSHDVAYFACLSGRSYLSPGEKSIIQFSLQMKLQFMAES